MENRKRLPVGMDSFYKIRTDNYYYVDKSKLLEELLSKGGAVNLFTRPRRFGKSMNMSMLRYFFEIGTEKTLFDGLYIAEKQELCEKYQGNYPVIAISLKDVSGLNYETACNKLKRIIGMEALRFSFLAKSEKLEDTEKEMYKDLIKFENGVFAMTDDTLCASLFTLSRFLEKYYGRPVVLLIDEYDVPLDMAFQGGYYDEMLFMIRSMLGMALKTNDSLEFAVLSGCLRISKESVFTGLNNFKVFSLTDVRFDEYFGFTDEEVKQLLTYYHLSGAYEKIKEWYDGYRFGEVSVYCPWDVINYCEDLLENPDTVPKTYWMNTSSNAVVKRFIGKANRNTQNEIENLIAGEAVWKTIRQELTYLELDHSIENLWSVLYLTGYLTAVEKKDDKTLLLAIPNKEIREIFIQQIKEWFSEITLQDMSTIRDFASAFKNGDVQTAENMFNAYLKRTISIRDASMGKSGKENFYHGILLGLFVSMGDWIVLSNAESGEGYSDILIETEDEVGIIIEVKYGYRGKLEEACEKALQQIEDRNYIEKLENDGMQKILKYGIGCYQKRCKIVLK